MFGDPQDINAARLISSQDVEKINVYSLESSWDRQGSVYIVYFTLSAVMSTSRVPTHPLLSQEETVWQMSALVFTPHMLQALNNSSHSQGPLHGNLSALRDKWAYCRLDSLFEAS